MAALLFHLIPVKDLQDCKDSGKMYFPRTYQQDKFTHLTANPQLLLSVANQFYQDSEGDWLLLVLDAAKLKGKVKYEAAAPVGNKPAKELGPGEEPEVFPHLYGGINLDAIQSELSVERDASGKFISIAGL